MDIHLPSHLDVRTRWQVHPEGTAGPPGEMVLYWLHNACRAHENPALDVAICLARQNGLPLLVYHGLCETYPYASDRHHAFILQGARDLQRQMEDRGIRYAFHLQRQGNRGPHLRDLTRRAAVLVTEETPVPPLTGWLERLASITTTPIACVDTSCLVSPGQFPDASTRAFEFRSKSKAMYRDAVKQPYVDQVADCQVFDDVLPFEPLDLQHADLANLIGQCRIDHGVAPVSDTPGGSREGYRRWDEFKRSGLNAYSDRRNDAADPLGVSRMSAYLHYGMVSPFRIAREADQHHAKKYLDELLIWRELSFHYCYFHQDELDTMEVIPDWSTETLQQHETDTRQKRFHWETLRRGRTGDSLWDACQQSLLRHGELHNNVRMTWGKAFIPWTDNSQQAMQLCTDLNHRYALDGRDPNSYGGILWCFGQFDRPFDPPQPCFGKVRYRSTKEHQRRINLDRYCHVVGRPIARSMPKVAIVGAGLGGLTAARTLMDHGMTVTLFDKSRGVGGRLATRRAEVDGRWLCFDHGAQCFTARDGRFAKHVQSWQQDGLVQAWLGRFVCLDGQGQSVQRRQPPARFVGTPTMNALAKHLAKDLHIHLGTRIRRISGGADQRYQLHDDSGNVFGDFDVVLVNCPPPQAADLLGDVSPTLAEKAQQVKPQPCWAAMFGCDQEIDTIGYDAAIVTEGPLHWVTRQASKPDHASMGSTSWVVHASSEWTSAHLDRPKDLVASMLLDSLRDLTGEKFDRVRHLDAHLWRFSGVASALDDECLWEPTEQLGVCGDWCLGHDVEAAFLSGQALAGQVLRHYTIDRAAVDLAQWMEKADNPRAASNVAERIGLQD
ncbi:FAD-dependent oxidoreductase [Crateriforma spongiae]|uniref:FAD-dependent oxidoreductase n=1 Tax=Crateriforma spongiae TaxID=2724528 RepID=UPI001445C3B6|nr:FAD-dependent oxidoreductase [Crateriforma spongiae]